MLLLGPGRPDAGDYLHMAAIAALTEVAVAEARDETEQSLRGSFLEEVLSRPELDAAEVARRASRLGCDLSEGYVACRRSERPWAGPSHGRDLAEVSKALASRWRAVYALRRKAGAGHRTAARPGRHAAVGVSSHRRAAEARRALEEAELGVVTAAGGGPPGEEIGEGTYRLLFRVLASHPQEVRSHEDTVAALVRYDEQYSTDLLGTLGVPRQQLQHGLDRTGDPRAPPHGGLPPGPGEGAHGPRPAQERGPRAPGAGPEGVSDHRADFAAPSCAPSASFASRSCGRGVQSVKGDGARKSAALRHPGTACGSRPD